jgi:hypothetical protein
VSIQFSSKERNLKKEEGKMKDEYTHLPEEIYKEFHATIL